MERANKSKRVVRDEKQRELRLEDVVSRQKETLHIQYKGYTKLIIM